MNNLKTIQFLKFYFVLSGLSEDPLHKNKMQMKFIFINVGITWKKVQKIIFLLSIFSPIHLFTNAFILALGVGGAYTILYSYSPGEREGSGVLVSVLKQ